MQTEIAVVGWFSVALSAAIAVIDLFMQGKSDGVFGFRRMGTISRARVGWGGALGVWLIPLLAPGCYLVYTALEPAGSSPAFAASILLAYFFATGAALHGAHPFMGSVHQIRARTPAPSDLLLQQVDALNLVYFKKVVPIPLACLFAASLIFSWQVATKTTALPDWQALLCPAAWIAGITLAGRRYSGSWFGYVVSARIHVVFIPFFLILTLSLS